MDRKVRFGIRLRALRRRRYITQERLAELIDRSVDAISKMERGVTLPNLETIMRLSENLNVPLNDLVDTIGDSPNTDRERVELEAALIDTVRSMDKCRLAIATELLQVLLRHGKR